VYSSKEKSVSVEDASEAKKVKKVHVNILLHSVCILTDVFSASKGNPQRLILLILKREGPFLIAL